MGATDFSRIPFLLAVGWQHLPMRGRLSALAPPLSFCATAPAAA
eukprot:CAMPEP_0178460186 /NCGR_PEP_ID=MMETSP0689_2-20121128/48552_1 /TAXON_ID=160604 /ORGANISM="Amphidinium massartii, Strain CS-259" /LENGTH=43 /DNA_ID= /DNA_START= /DNA_END= /DNA_ORIENTATION=